MSPRRVSIKSLETFNIGPIQTPRDLYDLQVELDHQCLQLVVTTDAITNAQVGTTEDLDLARACDQAFAERLSSSLNQSGHSGRYVFQEVQLRALVASLALLHHSGVHTMKPESWDKLKANISAWFNDITFQIRGESSLADKTRHTSNIYLVQLAWQYLSFIQRGDSKLPSVVGPAVKILFASISVVCEKLSSVWLH